MGDVIATLLSENHPLPLKQLGIKDEFGQSGKGPELLEHYGLTKENIVAYAKEVISKKNK